MAAAAIHRRQLRKYRLPPRDLYRAEKAYLLVRHFSLISYEEHSTEAEVRASVTNSHPHSCLFCEFLLKFWWLMIAPRSATFGTSSMLHRSGRSWLAACMHYPTHYPIVHLHVSQRCKIMYSFETADWVQSSHFYLLVICSKNVQPFLVTPSLVGGKVPFQKFGVLMCSDHFVTQQAHDRSCIEYRISVGPPQSGKLLSRIIQHHLSLRVCMKLWLDFMHPSRTALKYVKYHGEHALPTSLQIRSASAHV